MKKLLRNNILITFITPLVISCFMVLWFYNKDFTFFQQFIAGVGLLFAPVYIYIYILLNRRNLLSVSDILGIFSFNFFIVFVLIEIITDFLIIFGYTYFFKKYKKSKISYFVSILFVIFKIIFLFFVLNQNL